MISAERWLPVVGFAGIYEVSDQGRVRSLDRVQTYQRIDQYSGRVLTIRRRHKGRILRPGAQGKTGHLTVMLGVEEGSRQVHALVLEAFVGPCPDGYECCHRDDRAQNNHLSNLRWGTRSDNLHDAVRNGKKPIGDRHPGVKLKAADIPVIRARCKAGARPCDLGREYGVSEATIRQARDGQKAWKHITTETAP